MKANKNNTSEFPNYVYTHDNGGNRICIYRKIVTNHSFYYIYNGHSEFADENSKLNYLKQNNCPVWEQDQIVKYVNFSNDSF